MTAKEKFVQFVDLAMEDMSNVDEEVQKFWTDYKNSMKAPQDMTEKGAVVLKWMQLDPSRVVSAKVVADAIETSSRSVSGTFRKLVKDGYIEKLDGNPSSYKITNKGVNYTFDN